jgi:hypothetical protein
MVWILPVSGHLVNCISGGFLMLIHGEFVVNGWRSVVAMPSSMDVHYLGLELSEFRRFSWCGAF